MTQYATNSEEHESVEEQQPSKKGVVWVQYTEKGKAPVTLKLHGDPFVILAAVEARLFP